MEHQAVKAETKISLLNKVCSLKDLSWPFKGSFFILKEKLPPFSNNSLKNSSGFTLVELIVVIILVGLISSVAYTRVDSVLRFKQNETLRNFAGTWEFLYQHSIARGEAYRMIIDLEEETFQVLREIPLKPGEVKQVDYLSGLRTKGEKKRRKAKKLEEQMASVEEQLKLEAERRNGPLEELYYQMLLSGPGGDVKLTPVPEFEEMAEPSILSGIVFKDVKNSSKTITEDQAFIRFSPRGGIQHNLIHLTIEDAEYDYTLYMNPTTGKVVIEDGYKNYDWAKKK